ncbi:MAG: ATP-binding cassette domain-containing protein [Anaerolineae bacterium]|nr:ATP-binding cassette domain-containing protein [Anaerolineae bacterium]MCI0608190.1 ATP-binding cassette domain-containing protein [Anaerolineae bacterium]
MISITVSNTTLVLGSHVIFRDLSWEIQHDQKIGLIGPNGAGKSSLFKLMIGEHSPEKGGTVIKAKGVTVGYLPQHPEFELEKTALTLALEGNSRVAEIENELQRVESKLSDPEVYNNAKSLERVLDAQHKLLEEYESLGGLNYASRVRELLRGLGLPESDFEKPIRALSGGQKKLIGLARLMLARPSVLLLDEPDNHLDMPGKAYLEKLINDYPGAVVIISHDRYILDAIATHIAEIEDGKITTFIGNYTEYIVDKEKRLARQEELYQIQQREIGRLEMALKRYKTWVIFNDKFASRVHAMEARIERIEKIERPVLERRKMDLELNGWRGSNQVLEFDEVGKSFSPHPPPSPAGRGGHVLQNINFLIRHGERVGLIGANGAGKSVLLRLILGKEKPTLGEIKIGPSVKVGYYAQEHETLDFNQTVIDAVRLSGNMSESNAVSFLIRYLFTYQQVTQRIGSLSGGERSRLQLALLVLSGANFLLLDEPTNNLDIASAEVLENALNDFNGTVLVISHDRYFLDRTVSRIFALENAQITEYIGGYSDYAAKAGVHFFGAKQVKV